MVIFFGCGGHARSAADLILSYKKTKILFVDENARENEKILGCDVVRSYPLRGEDYFVAIGDNVKRKALFESLEGGKCISILSPRAYFGKESKIAKGCFIGNFCHIGPEVRIDDNTIINHGAVIEHEVQIGKHCHIGPNATISGRCTIGDLVFIGVGATIKDSISICSAVIVGAGATVVKDIVEPGTYVGTPARKL